jgi:hypothetical protein
MPDISLACITDANIRLRGVGDAVAGSAPRLHPTSSAALDLRQSS